jgi:type I restriction-modification system DNA methylase subunit
MLETISGKVFDPVYGSGGMFIQSQAKEAEGRLK